MGEHDYCRPWAGPQAWDDQDGQNPYQPMAAVEQRLRVVEDTLLICVAADRRLNTTTYSTVDAMWTRKLYMGTHHAYRRLVIKRGYALDLKDWLNLGLIPDKDIEHRHVDYAQKHSLPTLLKDRVASLEVALSIHANWALDTDDKFSRRQVNRTVGLFVMELEGLTNVLHGRSPWHRRRDGATI